MTKTLTDTLYPEAPMSLSYDQVKTALRTLGERGEMPTLRALRAELGTGSLGTIQKLLARWREEQQPSSPAALPLSNALQEALLQEIRSVTDRKTESLTRTLTLLKEEVQAIALENEEREREIHTLRHHLQERDDALQQMTGRISQLEQVLTDSRQRETEGQSKAETLLKSLAAAELRLEETARLREELEKTRQDRDREREGRVLAEKEAAVKEALLKRQDLPRRSPEVEMSTGLKKGKKNMAREEENR